MPSGARIRRIIRRLDGVLSRVETALVSGCLGFAALTAFGLIAGRNLLNRSYNALEEISVYLIIWMVFAGMMLADRARQHISIDIVHYIIPAHWQGPLQRIADGFQALVCLGLAWFSLDAVRFSWRIGERSVSTLEQPIWVLMSIMPLAFLVVGLRSLARSLGETRAREVRDEGVSSV
ncbi:MAG: TRAP transporter small permease [Alphaproteobacteria bacterium]|nr:TRAP transporter small permease [Alphaproteobacteria bacterium]